MHFFLCLYVQNNKRQCAVNRIEMCIRSPLTLVTEDGREPRQSP